MPDFDHAAWRISLAQLLPRRGLGRLLAGALGLAGLAAAAGQNAAAKKKKKKKKRKKKKCAGKTCNPGFACDAADGLCKCGSGVTCNNGGVCCLATQVCDDANACCSPEPDATTCEDTCGNVDNNCDQSVNCGGCTGDLVCFQNGCCDPEATQETCAGKCGSVENNCGQQTACGGCANGFTCSSPNEGVCECVSDVVCDATCCGASDDVCDAADDCCSPEAEEETCADTCGPVVNNCDEEIDCGGGCGIGEGCSTSNDCAAGLVCAAATNECAAAYIPIAQWGGPGTDPSEFNQPSDLAFDAEDNVYVVDWENERVQKFTSGGTFITTFGEAGFGDEQFISPYGIEVTADGFVQVTDFGHNHIKRWEPNDDGTQYSLPLADPHWGLPDPNPDPPNPNPATFNQPLFIAQDSAGNVYVSDSLRHRILKFDSNRMFVDEWGKGAGEEGTADGEFKLPYGVAVDSNADVYVVDRGNHRVQKFSSLGAHLATWGAPGSGPGEFNLPQGIAVDSFDDVYVADTKNHRIQKFTQDSAEPANYIWVTQLGTTATAGDAPGEFSDPVGVGLDSEDNLYVTELSNHRVQKFAPVTEAAPLRAAAVEREPPTRRKRGRERDRRRGKDRKRHG
jgi:streptogramin lyase